MSVIKFIPTKSTLWPQLMPFIVLITLGILLFFGKLNMPLTDGDSGYYGTIARNIVQSGNWQSLHYAKNDFVDKPPLSIWLIALPYRLFGIHNWSTKLGNALLVILSIIFCYLLAKELYSKRAAFWSGVVLTTSVLFFYEGQIPQQEIPFVFCTLLSFWALLYFFRTKKLGAFCLFWIGLGLATITRGMPAIVLIVSTVVLYLVARRILIPEKPDWFASRNQAVCYIILGVALFMITGLLWFFLEYLRQGPEFINFFFGLGLTKYLKPMFAGTKDPGFWVELPLLIGAMIPWAGFLWHALKRGWVDRHQQQGGTLLLLVWFVVAIGMTLTIKWRVIRYLLPAIPPLALLTGRVIEGALAEPVEDLSRNAFKTAAISNLVIIIPLFAGLVYIGFSQTGNGRTYIPLIIPFFVTCLGGMLLFSVLGFAKRYLAASIGMVCLTVVSFFLLLGIVDRNMEWINPWPKLTAQVAQMRQPGEKVVFLQSSEDPFITFYLGEHPLRTANLSELNLESISGRLKEAKRFFLLTSSPLKSGELEQALSRSSVVKLLGTSSPGRSAYQVTLSHE